jgi:hypothetical protein
MSLNGVLELLIAFIPGITIVSKRITGIKTFRNKVIANYELVG